MDEHLVSKESEGGLRRVTQNWMGRKTRPGLAQGALASGLAGFVFAFHDQDEIGPVMLARLAKKTGLRPDDL